MLADAADDGRAVQPERSITTAIDGADLEVIGDVGPAVTVPDDASAQDRLLAAMGRTP